MMVSPSTFIIVNPFYCSEKVYTIWKKTIEEWLHQPISIMIRSIYDHSIMDVGVELFEGYSAERVCTGNRGRPSVQVSRDQLAYFMSEGFTAGQISELLNCSKSVVYKLCYKNGLKFNSKFHPVSEEELTNAITNIHQRFPNSGSKMVKSYLAAEGLVVQRVRVCKILSRIDPDGTATRFSRSLKRRVYKVSTPNSLWHMDAHCKLIRWGFVTHGCIDGYSRMITYMKCTSSMTADTVLNLFAKAVKKYGVPSRVRSDRGYENLLVAVFMNVLRGHNRSSHITGRSVHNQRIERLWRDVFEQVIQPFHEEFYDLECQGKLNPDNNGHLFILQSIYFNEINNKLKLFMKAWNMHKIRTAKNRSPRNIWIHGILQNINTSHISIQDIFVEASVSERLRSSLSSLGVDINENIVQFPNIDHGNESSLRAQIELPNELMVTFENIVNSNENAKNKYLLAYELLKDVL